MDATWNEIVSMGLRWLHLLGAILWIGLGFYMNFVHMAYLPKLEPSARKTAMLGLVPRILVFMLGGATVSVTAGLLLGWVAPRKPLPGFDWLGLGISLGLVMFAVGLFIILPCTLMALRGFRTGIPMAPWAIRLLPLASRFNAFLSLPVVFCMLAGAEHFHGPLVPWLFGVLAVGGVLVWLLISVSGKIMVEV